MPGRSNGEEAAGDMLAASSRPTRFVEHARRYAELRWALIHLDGKRPKPTSWETTQPDPNPEHAAGLWNVWGERWNMGVVLGPSGLAVVEYDSDEAAATLLELLGGELPLTPTAETGRGRLHLYFRDAGVPKSARDGLELRTGPHQCVLPPSEHPDTGRPYRWLSKLEPWTVPLAEIPAAVLEHMAATRTNGAAGQIPEMIPEGERHTALLSLAGSMRRRGLDNVEILAALTAVNERRSGRPLPQSELETLAADVATRYKPDASAAIASGTPPDGREEQEPFELELLTARALCQLPDPPTSDELLGPLIVRGQRLVIGAHTGEGKTTWMLQATRAVVLGEAFLGWTGGGGGRALILDAEQGLRTVKRRLREAGLDDSELIDYVRVPDGLALDSDPRHVAALEDALATGGYALVCADPLYKLHAGDSNAEREAVDLMRRFDAWRERFGFALALPVHCRKPVPGLKFSIHDLFGSSAYVRGAEVVVGLQRLRDGYSRLHFLKDRDGDLEIGAKWGLLFDRERGYARDPDDGKSKPTAKDAARELLAQDPSLTAKQLETATGYAERTIRLALKELRDEADQPLFGGDDQ